MLRYRICNCSCNSNTANVLSCRPEAHTVMAMYMMRARTNMQLFTCATAVIDPPDLAQHHTPAQSRIAVPRCRVCDPPRQVPTARSNGICGGLSRPECSSTCRYLNRLATRSANLGIRAFFGVVHFFYIEGILSLPYQICHHGLHCYAGRWLRKFSSRCLADRVCHSVWCLRSSTVIVYYNMGHLCHTQINCELPSLRW